MIGQERVFNILIVEDSMGIARSLSLGLGLSQQGAYEIEICSSGEEALKKLMETHFDLLISDLRLPGIDGLTLLERTRQFRAATRCILITAFGSPEVEERVQELADAYLAKPFMIQDLIQIVEEILRKTTLRPPSPSSKPPVESDKEVVQTQFELRRSVHLTVLACDFDGTLAEHGEIAPATWEMLRAAKTAGIIHILVTGRTLDSFIATGPFKEVFKAIVAENGAVVYFTGRERVALPFGTLTPSLLQKWQTMNIPLERGMAIAATVKPHDEGMLRALSESRGCATVEYNRDAIMFLPSGASKGNGLIYALDELGYSAHNVLACGDAENDKSLFDAAELGVAVANAMPELRTTADVVLPKANGAGIRDMLGELLNGHPPAHRPRPDRALILGHRYSGVPVKLDPFNIIETNTAIFGASGSGKSWLAGLLMEELLKQKYQVCIIDPEGDYRALGAAPHTMVLGGQHAPLPPVTDVISVAEWNNVSLILDLSMYDREHRSNYLAEFLHTLKGLRARRGRPHYFLVDEVQSFCPPKNGVLTDLLLDAMRWGGVGLVSYRPSLVDQSLLERVHRLLITRLAMPEEIMTLRPWFAGDGIFTEIQKNISTLPRGQAYLCTAAGSEGKEIHTSNLKFRVGIRTVPHIRHLHKYLRTPLPGAKRFYFRSLSGKLLGTAASLWDFRELLAEIPVESLRMHLERGDFSAWVSEVLNDTELAQRMDKLKSHELSENSLRQVLEEIVAKRYDELELLV